MPRGVSVRFRCRNESAFSSLSVRNTWHQPRAARTSEGRDLAIFSKPLGVVFGNDRHLNRNDKLVGENNGVTDWKLPRGWVPTLSAFIYVHVFQFVNV